MPQAVIDGHQETLDGGAESARMILRAGGRLGMGGDYGFAWNPHGDYAKELTFFVKYVGFTPLEVIRCATQTGAEIMGRGSEFGTLAAGKLADVLVVDGDVLADITLLEDRRRFIAVMQGGIVKAGQLAAPAARRTACRRLTRGGHLDWIKTEPHRRGAATLCGSWTLARPCLIRDPTPGEWEGGRFRSVAERRPRPAGYFTSIGGSTADL